MYSKHIFFQTCSSRCAIEVRPVPFDVDRLLWFYRVIRKQTITIRLNPRVFRKLRIQLNNQNKRSKRRRRSLPANRHSLKLKRLLLLLKNYIIQMIYSTSICFQTSERFDPYVLILSSKFFTRIIAYSVWSWYVDTDLHLSLIVFATFTWYFL